MGDWEPDQVISVGNGTGYFWTVPAKVAGVWSVSGLQEGRVATLTLDQVFQRVGGVLQLNGLQQNLLGVRLDGAHLYFSFLNSAGQLKSVKALISGDRMSGAVVGPYGMVEIQPAPVLVKGSRRLSQ